MNTNSPADVPDRQLRALPLRRRRRDLAPDGGQRPPHRNGQGGYNCGVYVDPSNPDIVYTINTSSFNSTRRRQDVHRLQGRPGRRRPAADVDRSDRRPAHAARRRPGRDRVARRRHELELSGTTRRPSRSTTSRWTTRSPTGSTPPSRTPARSATRSRGDLGAITPLDWLPTPGYEFGSIVADPLNPKIIYAGGPGGGIVKITYPSGQWINVSPEHGHELSALRKVGNQPIAWSQTNPHELLAGFQYLMATTDGAVHWKAISPDLGYPKGVTPPPRRRPRRARGGRAGAPGAPARLQYRRAARSNRSPRRAWHPA